MVTSVSAGTVTARPWSRSPPETAGSRLLDPIPAEIEEALSISAGAAQLELAVFALIGPKLPRTIPSIEGLWFVGDGSVPIAGIWSEGAAGCGVLGARELLGRS